MDDLDAAIALVYAEPPSGFVTARAALVKELKAVKRKDDAATVAGLRRPTKLARSLGEAARQAEASAGGEAVGRDASIPADQERGDAAASERTRLEQEARARAERLSAAPGTATR